METLIVTGGAGFIGSCLIRYLIAETELNIVNIDKLTYAGNLESLIPVESNPRYQFEKVDICDGGEIEGIVNRYQPDAIMHLAAESHVDRSIDAPADFIQTNVVGTYTLLEVARRYWTNLTEVKQGNFRFHHVSTDEVYGSLGENGLFTETSQYQPNSPYSASKAASDHLVSAWFHTYGLPVVLTNCSNNYGPFQFPEKLIPLIILNALEGNPLPVYGDGGQVRDWLYVEDHARALYQVLTRGVLGEVYNIGGHNERTNLEVVNTVCLILEELRPEHPAGIGHYKDLITHVKDRPGHDRRYAIDATKIKDVLDWVPEETFETGLKKTVDWYLCNNKWCENVKEGSYAGERLGVLSESKE